MTAKNGVSPNTVLQRLMTELAIDIPEPVSLLVEVGSSILLGYECKYSMVAHLINTTMPVNRKVPTVWGEEGFTWNHNSANDKFIKGSIIVEDIVGDFDVKIRKNFLKFKKIRYKNRFYYVMYNNSNFKEV